MGEHFVLLVDRLLTESTLAAALESQNLAKQSAAFASEEITIKCHSNDECSSPKKMVECRICHDEDEDSNMETPCSCCGSLKYAHRRCIQRWCNEKGDTVCEICHQQFKPGYTAPPPLCQIGGIPMNFRGNWGIARRDLNNLRVISMVSTDRNFVEPEYDNSAASTPRSLFCCRSVVIIFMLLLILRHTLPTVASGVEFSGSMFLPLLLRTSGIVLPIYVMVKAVNAIQHRRRQLVSPSMLDTSSDEETG